MEDGILLIHSEIKITFCESVFRPLKKIERDEDIERIQIYLSTFGGDVNAALTYCDVIDRLEKSTTITLFGEVFSCGFIMACAGYKNPNVHTVCYPSVTAMMHSPVVFRYKDEPVTARALEELGDILTERKASVFEYIMSNSKITPELIKKIDAKDYYMNAKALLEYGVVDEIL